MVTLSRKTIERALLYIRTLEGLEKSGQNSISSGRLARMLGSTDVQIRKEISRFGSFGKPRVGYDTALLKRSLQDLLLKGRTVRAVLFGVGNLGKAILKHPGFSGGRIKLVAAFDQLPTIIGKKVNGIGVFGLAKASAIIRKLKADIGIIAVPEESCQKVADLMVEAGIRGIINFSPTAIRVDRSIPVKDIDLTIEFLSLYCDARLGKEL